MKTVLITQARMGSSRLPGKVLKEIDGQSLLAIQIERLKKSRHVDKIMVATTTNQEDDAICREAEKLGVGCYRGKEFDVLDRFYQIYQEDAPDQVIRITADCPLIDPVLIDEMIDFALEKDLDYTVNTVEDYPDGQDIEFIKGSALKIAWEKATKDSDREHVTPYIYDRSELEGQSEFKAAHYPYTKSYAHIRMTVDEPQDFELVQLLIKELGLNGSWLDYADFIEENKEVKSINAGIIKNEGYLISLEKEKMGRYSKSEEFLATAQEYVPLGSQTFSKSKTQLPFGVSPYFAERAEGAYFWDIDGNKYVDLLNGLAAITLGHNFGPISEAVKAQVDKGTIFSLASQIEYEVASKIVDMVPCAEMVRFGKNGSDATTGAIRLARAYTGKEHVALCGYHGWQDWYIGSTSRDMGVPSSTKELSHQFKYNDLESLRELLEVSGNEFAAVILEPTNVFPPAEGFLEGIRDLAHKHGALLIYDETVTGFRLSNGGAQELFGVTPDLATFGKGLANGYPVSAIAGKKEVMMLMEEIFFSFTFGGETLSLAAANVTLDLLAKEPVLDHIKGMGQSLMDQIQDSITRYGLEDVVDLLGAPVWFFLIPKDHEQFTSWEFKTLYMQEMFQNGVFGIGSFNLSYSFTQTEVDYVAKQHHKFFEKLRGAMDRGNVQSLLKCDPIVPLFKVR